MGRGLVLGELVREGGGVAVREAWRADGWWTRLRGLLGRPPLADDATQALVLEPCSSVHTLGMRYPLDLIFLDRSGQVCGWSESVPPRRARSCRGARLTIELHAGAVRRLKPTLGERWTWQPAARPQENHT